VPADPVLLNLHFIAALSYADRGWYVVANHSVTLEGMCTCADPRCSDPGKHPVYDRILLAHGFYRATCDAVLLGRWWTQWPWANIGLRTGAQSGLLVLDVDPRHGGHERLAPLEQAYGPLPETVEALTGALSTC